MKDWMVFAGVLLNTDGALCAWAEKRCPPYPAGNACGFVKSIETDPFDPLIFMGGLFVASYLTRHPFLWEVAVWAFVHLIVNGDVASLVLFGSLLVLVFVGMISIEAKRKKTFGQHWDSYAAATSITPFHALKESGNTPVIAEFKVWQLVVARVLYLAVMHFHQAWFGASPLFYEHLSKHPFNEEHL